MSSGSRWAEESPHEKTLAEQKKREKEAKKRAREQRQQRLLEEERSRNESQNAAHAAGGLRDRPGDDEDGEEEEEQQQQQQQQNVKRRRVDDDGGGGNDEATVSATTTAAAPSPPRDLLRFPAREWRPCRHVDNFEKLNRIEEGSYGYVSRAREKSSGDVVALKKLKLDRASNDGFPITGLREMQTLSESRHENILHLREVLVGDTLDDVYIVMDFIEHDLNTLLDDMREPFLPSETKTVLLQILRGTQYLHDNWILHRDLKTSNLLMNNRGEVKIADFGMARYYADPPPKLTQLVVTLWYRSPELLLGTERYGAEIDMWSVGCIFGELLLKEPLLRGKKEVEQLSKIFALTGPPTTRSWPSFRSLPNAKSLHLPSTSSSTTSTSLPSPTNPFVPLLSHTRFPDLSASGLDLLSNLLALNPAVRLTATQALQHEYFREQPLPKPREMLPTFPSKAGMEKKRRRWKTPEAPKHGDKAPRLEF